MLEKANFWYRRRRDKHELLLNILLQGIYIFTGQPCPKVRVDTRCLNK
jgi:hypothetical protein